MTCEILKIRLVVRTRNNYNFPDNSNRFSENKKLGVEERVDASPTVMMIFIN